MTARGSSWCIRRQGSGPWHDLRGTQLYNLEPVPTPAGLQARRPPNPSLAGPSLAEALPHPFGDGFRRLQDLGAQRR